MKIPKPSIEVQTIHWAKKNKRQTMIYKTLHRKLKIKAHEPHKRFGESATLVAPVVLFMTISHKCEKDGIGIKTIGAYQWSSVTYITRNGQILISK